MKRKSRVINTAPRVHLETIFKEKLLDLALDKVGDESEMGTLLGYQIVKRRRFRELREGITKTLSIQQLEILSKITGIPMHEIRKHIIKKN